MSAPATPENTQPNTEALPDKVLPAWSCGLNQKGAELNSAIRVGDVVEMSCTGSTPIAALDPTSTQIQFKDEKLSYTLRILKQQEAQNDRALFIVTAYKPGEQKDLEFEVVDKKTGEGFSSQLSFNVESVLTSEEQQKPEPIGPLGPIVLSMPWWYWAGFVALFLFIGLILLGRVRRYLERKKLIEEMRGHQTALTPFNQFNKDLRILNRQLTSKSHTESLQTNYKEVVAAIENLFRLYLIRELLIPALIWSDREVLKDLKKRHRNLYDENLSELKKLFIEFSKARNTTGDLGFEDTEQIVNMSRSLVEKINHMRRTKK